MKENKTGIMNFIEEIDNNIKTNQTYSARFQNKESRKKRSIAISNESIEDFKTLKENFEPLSLNVSTPGIAYQYVRIRSNNYSDKQ